MGVMGKQRKNPVSDEQIIAAYKRLRSAYKVARELRVGGTTVYRVLARHGVNAVGLEEYRTKAVLFAGEKAAEIVRLYTSGVSAAELVRRFGGSIYSIKRTVERAGAPVRTNPCPRIKEGERERILALHRAGMGQMRISLEVGRSQSFVSRVLRSAGVDGFKPSGEEHAHWKGGRWVNGMGYMMVKVESEDPLACMRVQNGYILEHRLVMARKLGRPLLPTETVHHIDGDRLNNSPENLQLRQGRHGKGVVMCCLDCGSHNVGPAPITEE